MSEGALEYEVDGKPPVTLKAGDALFIPYGTVHSARNPGSVNAAELATYIVEKGKPLLSSPVISLRDARTIRELCNESEQTSTRRGPCHCNRRADCRLCGRHQIAALVDTYG